MSKTSLLFGIILLILSSCSAIKDAITVPVTTNLQVDVPITVASVKSANLNDKAVTFYSFTATKVLQVADNVDMTSYINKIKSVDLRGVTVTIATLTGSDQVLTLDLAVTGIQVLFFRSPTLAPPSTILFLPPFRLPCSPNSIWLKRSL